MPFTASELVALLRLERVDEFRFRGHSPPHRRPRIYGGQMIAQSIMAMGQTVHSGHRLHSIHGYFLQPGDIEREILFEVAAVRQGRSFSTRTVTASQGERSIFNGMASFQIAEGDGHRHLEPMPDVEGPDTLESEQDFMHRQAAAGADVRVGGRIFASLIERRSAFWQALSGELDQAPRYGIWCRLRESVQADALMHQALAAYVSDLDLMNTAVRPRGISLWSPSAQAASLDHAMWFHAPIHADEWFYYELDGLCAVNNRGLGIGGMYQHGWRVVSTAQEGLLRVIPGAGR